LGWLVSQGEWQSTADVLTDVSSVAVVGVVALSASGLLFRFLMWYGLLRHIKPVSYRTAAEIDLIVNFVNQLLPSQLSGRSLAPLLVSRRVGVDMGTAIGLTGVSTGLYAIVYGMVALLGIGVLFEGLSTSILGLVGLSTALYVAAGVVVLVAGLNSSVVDGFVRRFEPLVRRLPRVGSRFADAFDRIPEFTHKSMIVFSETLRSPRTVGLYLVGWIGSVALFPALRIAVLFEALGASFTPVVFLPVIIIAAYSVTLLPLTPGGIGITEATAAVVFVSLGVPYEIAASSVLVDRVIGVYGPALLGWYPMVRTNLSVPGLE
jgi:uncharacterized protein (TIRG00374 family)